MSMLFANGFLGLPDHFISDLLAAGLFGLLVIVLVAFGFKFCDKVWTKLDLERQVQTGNVAAGIVMGALVFGLCVAMGIAVHGILG